MCFCTHCSSGQLMCPLSQVEDLVVRFNWNSNVAGTSPSAHVQRLPWSFFFPLVNLKGLPGPAKQIITLWFLPEREFYRLVILLNMSTTVARSFTHSKATEENKVGGRKKPGSTLPGKKHVSGSSEWERLTNVYFMILFKHCFHFLVLCSVL